MYIDINNTKIPIGKKIIDKIIKLLLRGKTGGLLIFFVFFKSATTILFLFYTSTK